MEIWNLELFFKHRGILLGTLKKEIGESDNEIYWNQGDGLSKEQINTIIEGKINDVENAIWEMNIDYGYDNEITILKEVLENNDLELHENVEWPDVRDFFMEDLPGLDVNIKQLINNTPAVGARVVMYSNYDCLNSHYLNDYGDYRYDDNIKQIVDILYLNPAKVKQHMLKAGWEPKGSWKNLKYREGKEYVSYDDLIQELENNTCCSLLNFFGLVNLNDFIGIDCENEPKSIVVPKGNKCGLLDTFQGGGSVWEMELLRDMKIDLTKPHQKGYGEEYNVFGFTSDEGGSGYSAEQIAGLTREFWGEELKISI